MSDYTMMCAKCGTTTEWPNKCPKCPCLIQFSIEDHQPNRQNMNKEIIFKAVAEVLARDFHRYLIRVPSHVIDGISDDVSNAVAAIAAAMKEDEK